MRGFHKPRDEQRSIVIVRSKGYGDWLDCRSAEEARSSLQVFPSELMAAVASAKPSCIKPDPIATS
ncbi:hypothetical protein [Paraburkholderia caribensis]|uniref:hypothetical protein n=1 Tax=Paraburkholderia caribensis TaxID=75105 RepID=UPI0006D47E44|nr:hypothetical protein [Paraburkholderia caribensis]